MPLVKHGLALAILFGLVGGGRAQQGPEDGYFVQIVSQRTVTEALASFRVLQERFPGVLGGKSPVVRGSELPSRGTFYRVFVGPFATEQEATQVCIDLKAAGGACFVPRRINSGDSAR